MSTVYGPSWEDLKAKYPDSPCRALRTQSAITVLDFSKSDITDRDIQYLFEKCFLSLDSLSLNDCLEIDTFRCQTLSSRVKRLYIRRSSLKEFHGGEALRCIEELDFVGSTQLKTFSAFIPSLHGIPSAATGDTTPAPLTRHPSLTLSTFTVEDVEVVPVPAVPTTNLRIPPRLGQERRRSFSSTELMSKLEEEVGAKRRAKSRRNSIVDSMKEFSFRRSRRSSVESLTPPTPNMPSMPPLPSELPLTTLNVFECLSLEDLPDLSLFPRLHHLKLNKESKTIDFGMVTHLTWESYRFPKPPTFKSVFMLYEIDLSNSEHIIEGPDLIDMVRLYSVRLDNNPHMKKLGKMENLPRLRIFSLINTPTPENMFELDEFKNVRINR